VESTTKWPWFHGSLQSLGTLSHGGGGGAKIWIDRDREIVGVYFEACLRGDEEAGEHYWNVDLFENLVTSAWDGA
jgi:CubicO group peptidase (beta-lactamase class C family)